jgi:hypothetical protein
MKCGAKLLLEMREFIQMATPVKLFKNKHKPYRILAVDDDKHVLWVKMIDDNPGSIIEKDTKLGFNNMIANEEWDLNSNTGFTFSTGKFEKIE